VLQHVNVRLGRCVVRLIDDDQADVPQLRPAHRAGEGLHRRADHVGLHLVHAGLHDADPQVGCDVANLLCVLLHELFPVREDNDALTSAHPVPRRARDLGQDDRLPGAGGEDFGRPPQAIGVGLVGGGDGLRLVVAKLDGHEVTGQSWNRPATRRHSSQSSGAYRCTIMS
jgi:hypothetical protein